MQEKGTLFEVHCYTDFGVRIFKNLKAPLTAIAIIIVLISLQLMYLHILFDSTL